MGLGVAAGQQRRHQIWPAPDAVEPRHVSVAEGEAQGLRVAPLAPGEVVHRPLTVEEVGTDAHVVGAHQLRQVVQVAQEVLQPRSSRLKPAHDGAVGRDPDVASGGGRGCEDRVRDVAGHVAKGAGVGVGEGHGVLRVGEHVLAEGIARVGEVDKHSEAVHLSDELYAEVGQPLVRRLQAAVPQQVTLHVGGADYPDSEPVEDGEQLQVVLDRGSTLEAQDQPEPALSFAPLDVARGGHQRSLIRVGVQHAVVVVDGADGLPEVVGVCGHGQMHGREPGLEGATRAAQRPQQGVDDDGPPVKSAGDFSLLLRNLRVHRYLRRLRDVRRTVPADALSSYRFSRLEAGSGPTPPPSGSAVRPTPRGRSRRPTTS